MRSIFKIFIITAFVLNFTFSGEFSDFSSKSISGCKSPHFARNMNSKELSYCSLGELAIHMMSEDIVFSSIRTVDPITGDIIDSNKAFYAINDDEVYGFKDRDEALKFGSEILDLDSAFDLAFDIESKRLDGSEYKNLKKFYPMGKRIYDTRCPKINASDFVYISELKSEVLNSCKNLDDRLATLATQYLWANLSLEVVKFRANEDEKCPVCGMFPYKYPRWAIVHGELDSGDRFVFDGMKCSVRFMLYPERYGHKDFKFDGGYATDYYTGNMMKLEDAYFVIGSDVLGPMGEELIPFAKESDANAFRLEHRGKGILRFDEIDECVLGRLDGKGC